MDDFEKTTGTKLETPPRIEQVAKIFTNGPIILTSMFAKYDVSHFQEEKRSVTKLRKQRDERMDMGPKQKFPIVDSRTYISKFGLGECGNDQRKGSDNACWMVGDAKAGREPDAMHRCVGKRGGHPSLVVWDIVETLHRSLAAEMPP